jgi:ATP-dependent Clp protease ATP-binding subunit ClpA
MEIIDCTTFSSEGGLFGPRMGIVGTEKGSRLNNFLARKHGQRALVFMDEFEKTNHSVHNALLLPFDNGN